MARLALEFLPGTGAALDIRLTPEYQFLAKTFFDRDLLNELFLQYGGPSPDQMEIINEAVDNAGLRMVETEQGGDGGAGCWAIDDYVVHDLQGRIPEPLVAALSRSFRDARLHRLWRHLRGEYESVRTESVVQTYERIDRELEDSQEASFGPMDGSCRRLKLRRLPPLTIGIVRYQGTHEGRRANYSANRADLAEETDSGFGISADDFFTGQAVSVVALNVTGWQPEIAPEKVPFMLGKGVQDAELFQLWHLLESATHGYIHGSGHRLEWLRSFDYEVPEVENGEEMEEEEAIEVVVPELHSVEEGVMLIILPRDYAPNRTLPGYGDSYTLMNMSFEGAQSLATAREYPVIHVDETFARLDFTAPYPHFSDNQEWPFRSNIFQIEQEEQHNYHDIENRVLRQLTGAHIVIKQLKREDDNTYRTVYTVMDAFRVRDRHGSFHYVACIALNEEDDISLATLFGLDVLSYGRMAFKLFFANPILRIAALASDRDGREWTAPLGVYQLSMIEPVTGSLYDAMQGSGAKFGMRDGIADVRFSIWLHPNRHVVGADLWDLMLLQRRAPVVGVKNAWIAKIKKACENVVRLFNAEHRVDPSNPDYSLWKEMSSPPENIEGYSFDCINTEDLDAIVEECQVPAELLRGSIPEPLVATEVQKTGYLMRDEFMCAFVEAAKEVTRSIKHMMIVVS